MTFLSRVGSQEKEHSCKDQKTLWWQKFQKYHSQQELSAA